MNATDWEKQLKSTTQEEIKLKHRDRKEIKFNVELINLLRDVVNLLKERNKDLSK